MSDSGNSLSAAEIRLSARPEEGHFDIVDLLPQRIHAIRDEFPVTRMRKILEVSTRGYRARRGPPLNDQEMAGRRL